MARAFTIGGAEAVNGLESSAERFGDSAFDALFRFADDYTAKRCSLQQVVNVPLGLLIFPKVAVQPRFEAAESGADIGVMTGWKINNSETADSDSSLFRQFNQEEIASSASESRVIVRKRDAVLQRIVTSY